MKDSKFKNDITIDEIIQDRPGIPWDYHCTCELCNPEKFKGEIFHNDSNKYYSNKARKKYYIDKAGDHLDVGHFVGYRWAIQKLCPEGGIVLDPTVGSGTAIVEAINNGRNGIGIELEYPDITRKNIEAQNNTTCSKYFRQGNAIYIDSYLKEWGIKEESIDLIINGTPYPTFGSISSDSPERKNIIDKTKQDKSFDYEHPDNIGRKRVKEWESLIRIMYSDSIKYLKRGGYFVIIVKDLVQNKKAYNLHKQIIDIVLSENFDVEYEGFFLHKHVPTTMFINTYPKMYPDVKIPLYQTGIILKKI